MQPEQGPVLQQVSVAGPQELLLQFNEAVDSVTARNTSNYSVSSGMRPIRAPHAPRTIEQTTISGQLSAASELERLANLPTLDGARSMLLGVLQAPYGQLVRTLAEPGAQLARVMNARAQQSA